MPYYDIAGLRVRIERCGGRTEKQARPYLSQNQNDDIKADIVIDVSDEKINSHIEKHPELGYDDWAYMLTGSAFYAALLNFNGMLLRLHFQAEAWLIIIVSPLSHIFQFFRSDPSNQPL